jgi:hypothetical protein
VSTQHLVYPEALLSDVIGPPHPERDHAGRYGASADAVNQNERAGGAAICIGIQRYRLRGRQIAKANLVRLKHARCCLGAGRHQSYA